MMKIHLAVPFFFIIILSASNINAQIDNDVKFSCRIDPSMTKTIAKKKIKNNTTIADIATVKNDLIDTFPIMTMDDMPCYTLAHTKGDTITLIIMPMFTPGYGVVAIHFYNDTAVVTNAEAPKDGEKRYKSVINDKDFESSIVVKPILCRITLAEKPNCNGNIQGYIEYESGNYFIKNDKGLEKRSYKLKGYFKSNCENK